MKKYSTLNHRRPSKGSLISCLLAGIMLVPLSAFSQEADSAETGKVVGGYTVNQTIEVGGRIVDKSGSEGMYGTLVDLSSGPRLLDYSLRMDSIAHTGTLIDDLTFSNAGYGGDPEMMSRLRISKNRFYDFSAQYRKNRNFYDYNAFANPYNYGPTVAKPNNPTVVQFNDSIHEFNTRRQMGDFNLTLMPQSKYRVRLGYSRVLNEGPSYSSFHEGTDVQLFQNFADRQDQYTVGLDATLAPRTTLSYDQTLVHGNVNTTYRDTNVGNAFINVGGVLRPVDPGAIWNPYYGQPCANPAVSSTGVLTPTNCGIYGGYSRSGPVVTDLPTERLSFVSNYWKSFDINGDFNFTSGESYIRNYYEQANAFVTRTNEVGFQFSGPTDTKRIDANANFGLTYHINDSWSFSEQFRWLNWRSPGLWESTELACFPNTTVGVNVFTPPGVPVGGGTTCAGLAASGTPQHTAGSGPDQDVFNYVRELKQETYSDSLTLQWDPTHRFGAHVGYRYGYTRVNGTDWDNELATYLPANVGVGNARPIGTVSLPADPDDATTANDEVKENAILFGIVTRPVDAWRINFDMEWINNSNALTPIWPMTALKTKLRSSYRVAKWGTVQGSLNLLSNSNNVVAQNPDGSNAFPAGYHNPTHSDHSNAYNLGFLLEPMKSMTLDFGYTYNNVASTSGSCLMASSGGGNLQSLTPEGGPINRCPAVGDPFVPGLLGAAIPTVLDYSQGVQNGYINLIVRPVKRVTVTAGYELVNDSGKNNWLRADTMALLRYPVDASGNVIYGGNVQAGPFAGYVNAPNPFQPLGTLYMSWTRPSASLEIELHKNLVFKGQYNYYDYHEKGPKGPIMSINYPFERSDFNATIGTLSLKYTF